MEHNKNKYNSLILLNKNTMKSYGKPSHHLEADKTALDL